jgi:hypothetical protein
MVESSLAEHRGDLFLGRSCRCSDHPLEASAALGQSYDARSPVGRIGLAHEIALLLHVSEQFVNGLLGDLHPLGDVDGP